MLWQRKNGTGHFFPDLPIPLPMHQHAVICAISDYFSSARGIGIGERCAVCIPPRENTVPKLTIESTYLWALFATSSLVVVGSYFSLLNALC